MTYKYGVGDKVACVDGKFPPGIGTLYNQLPAEGQAYVVRDMQLGVALGPGRRGEVSVLLVGVVNPRGPAPACAERGFAGWRFVPLAEFRRAEAEVEKALEWAYGKEGVMA